MHLRSLTGLRFFAALLVFCAHTDAVGPIEGTNVLTAGRVGVSFFFVLSGFVLAWSHRDQDRASSFYRRRFARIYPTYVAAWVIVVGLGALAGHFDPYDLVALTLLQAWWPDPDVYFAASLVFWTLSCEAFFYLVYPWFAGPLGRLSSSGRMWGVGLIVIAVTLVTLVAWSAGADERGSVAMWLLVIFPVTRLAEFVLGVLLANGLREGQWRHVPLAVAAGLAALSVVVASSAPPAWQRVSITLVPIAVLIVAAAQSDLSGRRTWLGSRALVQLGVWSYAFYLLHLTVLQLGSDALEAGWDRPPGSLGALGGAVYWSVALGASIGCAALVHRHVEAPMEKRLRPAATRRKLVDGSEPRALGVDGDGGGRSSR